MRTATTKRLMTVDEFMSQHGHRHGVELIEGVLRRHPMPGSEHSGIEGLITLLLLSHAKEKGLGRVLCGEALMRVRRDPDTCRAADVVFVSYKRWPKKRALPKGPLEVAPELVVEIRSPSDRMKAIRKKTEDYLTFGVLAVMVVDPETESIAVFRDEELPQRFHNGDTVTLPDVLPGFSAPVKAFFE